MTAVMAVSTGVRLLQDGGSGWGTKHAPNAQVLARYRDLSELVERAPRVDDRRKDAESLARRQREHAAEIVADAASRRLSELVLNLRSGN